QENMMLLAGATHSLFVSHDKLLQHIANQQYIAHETSLGNTNVRMKAGKVVIPEEILLSYSEDKAVINTFLALHYHYLESLAPIAWQVQEDSKEIEGLTCYLATATYLGRVWEAWFCPNIAIPAGPWLLRGLPGLIVEARDSKAEVSYCLIRIESADVPNEVIDRLEDYQKVGLSNKSTSRRLSKDEFNKLQEAAYKDPRGFMIAQIRSTQAQGNLFDLGVSNRLSWSTPITNPIALGE